MFVFHLMASAVSNRGSTCTLVQGAVRYDDGDFVNSIMTRLYKFLVMRKSAAPLHLKMSSDDIIETFDVAKLRKMLSMEAKQGRVITQSSGNFWRAGAAKEKIKV